MSWNNLSLKEKAEYIKIGVKNGLTNIDDIKSNYNKFADGGFTAGDGSMLNYNNTDYRPQGFIDNPEDWYNNGQVTMLPEVSVTGHKPTFTEKVGNALSAGWDGFKNGLIQANGDINTSREQSQIQHLNPTGDKEEWKNRGMAGLYMTPIIGTGLAGRDFYNEPNLLNGAMLGLSAIPDVALIAKPAYRIGKNIKNYKQHIFANSEPYGYNDINRRIKDITKSILSGEPANIDNPKWFNANDDILFNALFPEGDWGYSNDYIKLRIKLAAQARYDAYAKRLGLKQKFNTFTENPFEPGTFTDKKAINAIDKHYKIPSFRAIDFVNSAGGNTDPYIYKTLGENKNGNLLQDLIIYDTWDINPFKRPNDRIDSRIQNIIDKYKYKYDAFKSDNKYFKFLPDIKAPNITKNKTIKSLSDYIANKDVLELVGGEKPFKIRYDIPVTRTKYLDIFGEPFIYKGFESFNDKNKKQVVDFINTFNK